MDLLDDFVEPAMDGLGVMGPHASAPAPGMPEPDPNWQPV